MLRRAEKFNNKRKLQLPTQDNLRLCKALVNKVGYGGNPEHKKNPGDFNLNPPASPRAAKSLCDAVQIFSKEEALRYLKAGLQNCMISLQMKGNWPQNIWALTNNGEPLEAQLENEQKGTYHGYPMPESDPLSYEVIKEWNKRNGIV